MSRAEPNPAASAHDDGAGCGAGFSKSRLKIGMTTKVHWVTFDDCRSLTPKGTSRNTAKPWLLTAPVRCVVVVVVAVVMVVCALCAWCGDIGWAAVVCGAHCNVSPADHRVVESTVHSLRTRRHGGNGSVKRRRGAEVQRRRVHPPLR